MGHIAHMSSCRSVALRSLKVGMGDRRATVPPIVKTAYLMRRKSCARFGLHFSRYLLCQVKKTDKINTRHIKLLEKKYKQTSNLLELAAVGELITA